MGSAWKSPVTLEHSKADLYMYLRESGYGEDEVRRMSTLKVNMIIQRKNEPVYKDMIESEIRKAQQAENGGSQRTHTRARPK